MVEETPPKPGFPYFTQAKRDQDGGIISTLYTLSLPSATAKTADMSTTQQGKGHGGKGAKGKGPAAPAKGKGSGGDAKGKGKGPKGGDPKGHWYTLDGNFQIEIGEDKKTLRYVEGDDKGDLVEKDGAINAWEVLLPSGRFEVALTKVDAMDVLTRTSEQGQLVEARKQGNIFVTEVLDSALLVRNHGLETGAEVTYSLAGQTSPFPISSDVCSFYVRALPGIPSGRLELYDSSSHAKAARQRLTGSGADGSGPCLALSDAGDGSEHRHCIVHCPGHGFSDGERVLLSGVLDKSKLDSKPWDALNAEFTVSDSGNDIFKLKIVGGSSYFDASSCVGKAFDGISAKVCSVQGRHELNPASGAGKFGTLIGKDRKFGGASGMSQLLGSLDEVMEQKNKETVDADDVDMSIDESSACEKRQCPRCEKFFRIDMFDSHWSAHSSEILPNLFLGGNRNAWNDVEIKKRTGITHVLNVASAECASDELLRYYYTEKKDEGEPITFLAYKAMPLNDTQEFDILSQLDEASQFIRDALDKGEKHHVFVHCAQGISRSTSAVLAYLMGPPRHMTLKAAYDHVKERRDVARPNPSFIKQLGELELTLHSNLKEATLKVAEVWPTKVQLFTYSHEEHLKKQLAEALSEKRTRRGMPELEWRKLLIVKATQHHEDDDQKIDIDVAPSPEQFPVTVYLQENYLQLDKMDTTNISK